MPKPPPKKKPIGRRMAGGPPYTPAGNSPIDPFALQNEFRQTIPGTPSLDPRRSGMPNQYEPPRLKEFKPHPNGTKPYWQSPVFGDMTEPVADPIAQTVQLTYLTPIFDVRPDLRDFTGEYAYDKVVPLTPGRPYALTMLFEPRRQQGPGGPVPVNEPTVGFWQGRPFVTERAHTYRWQRVRNISEEQDLSEDFRDGNEIAILTFSPPRGVRFWQLQLRFTGTFPLGLIGTPRPYNITAAIY